MTLTFDPGASQIMIETFAEGLLSALAHDLRIEARDGEGKSDGDDAITLSFPVRGLVLVESSKKGKGDYHAPSEGDRKDIEARIKEQVFPGSAAVIVHAVKGGPSLRVVGPHGEQSPRVRASVREEAGALVAEGECELSLATLGTGKVHVPMGAIRLKDHIRVRFKAVFRRA
ncbi:MAG: hypothetical protein ABI551_13585 [Polyangiaceae bacterium]